MVDLSHSCLICIIFFKSCNETVVYIGILWCVLYDCSLHTPLGIMGNHMHRSKSAWRSSSLNGFLSVYLFFLQETSIPLYVAVFYTIENSVLWSFIHCTVVTKLAAMTWLQCWHRTLPLGAAASPSPVDLAESVGGTRSRVWTVIVFIESQALNLFFPPDREWTVPSSARVHCPFKMDTFRGMCRSL